MPSSLFAFECKIIISTKNVFQFEASNLMPQQTFNLKKLNLFTLTKHRIKMMRYFRANLKQNMGSETQLSSSVAHWLLVPRDCGSNAVNRHKFVHYLNDYSVTSPVMAFDYQMTIQVKNFLFTMNAYCNRNFETK